MGELTRFEKSSFFRLMLKVFTGSLLVNLSKLVRDITQHSVVFLVQLFLKCILLLEQCFMLRVVCYIVIHVYFNGVLFHNTLELIFNLLLAHFKYLSIVFISIENGQQQLQADSGEDDILTTDVESYLD